MFKSNIVFSETPFTLTNKNNYEEIMLQNKSLSGILLAVEEVSYQSTNIYGLFSNLNNNDELTGDFREVLNYCGLLGGTINAVGGILGSNYPLTVITPEGRKPIRKAIIGSETYYINLSQLDKELLFNYGNRKVKSKYCDLIDFQYRFYNVDNQYIIPRYYYFNGSAMIYFVDEILELGNICTRLLRTIETEYDPLKPFSIILSETINDVKSSTNNRTRNLVDNSTYSGTDNVLNDEILQSTYGFTQASPRNTGKEVGKRNTASSSTDNVHRSGTDKYVINHDDTHTRNYTRTGNIGNANYSKLIEDERKKIKFEFRKYIIESIVDILCDGTWCD